MNKEYFQTRWQKNKKKYNRFTININNETFEKLEKLEKATGKKKSKILKRAVENALSDEKLILNTKEFRRDLINVVSRIDREISKITLNTKNKNLKELDFLIQKLKDSMW